MSKLQVLKVTALMLWASLVSAGSTTPVGGQAMTQDQLTARWGILADLAGKDFISEGFGHSFRWKSNTEIVERVWAPVLRGDRALNDIVVTTYGLTSDTGVISVKGDRSGIATGRIANDGSVTIEYPKGRVIYRYSDGVYRRQIGQFSGGALVIKKTAQYTPIKFAGTEAQKAATIRAQRHPLQELQSIASAAQTPQIVAPTTRQVRRAATSAPTPVTVAAETAEQELTRRWGPLAKLAGRTIATGMTVAIYAWEDVGRSLTLSTTSGLIGTYRLTSSGIVYYAADAPGVAHSTFTQITPDSSTSVNDSWWTKLTYSFSPGVVQVEQDSAYLGKAEPKRTTVWRDVSVTEHRQIAERTREQEERSGEARREYEAWSDRQIAADDAELEAVQESNRRGPNAYEVLRGMADAAGAKVEEAQGQLEGAMAREGVLDIYRGERLPGQTPNSAKVASSNVGSAATSGDAASTSGSVKSSSSVPQAVPGKPLTFVLSVSTKQPINGRNGFCFSSPKTIPGPLGWGQSGSANTGATGRATPLVKAYFAQFIQKCSAATSIIPSSVEIAWNDLGTEDRPQASYNRHREQGMVEVTLN